MSVLLFILLWVLVPIVSYFLATHLGENEKGFLSYVWEDIFARDGFLNGWTILAIVLLLGGFVLFLWGGSLIEQRFRAKEEREMLEEEEKK